MSKEAIGIFDSGIGGLTIASGIARALPRESIIYFGDTAHLPYGNKSAQSIQSYALAISDFLIAKSCKIIVIACNSASAVATEILVDKFEGQVPVVNVIEPLVDEVSKKDFDKIGVIASQATVRSDIYAKTLTQKNPNLEVVSLATGLLAPMVEEGFLNGSISQTVINQYLSYPDFADIQALLLACTHYPLVRNEIEGYFEAKVHVLDAIQAVAKKVSTLLQEIGLEAAGNHRPKYQFFVSDYTQNFKKITRLFYGEQVELELAHWKNDCVLKSH